LQLAGRNILITGASQGLGAAIARACVDAGASILICARDTGLLEKTRSELAAAAGPGQRVVAQTADVGDEKDVRRLFKVAVAEFPRLDGVVNNAGVYGPKGLLENVDLAEWWDAIRINLLGVALICREAVPIFRRQSYGKIVNLSGGGATAPLPRISAYAASKAAVVRLTETLAVETAGSGIDVNSIAPGALNTRLLDEVIAAGSEQVGSAFYENALKQKAQGGAPLERGAELCVYLLSAASDGISGRLISAIWDPWQDLASFGEALRKSDIYTLRRIVPADRGLKWE
jgi:NAD(P)-dependent dehydrogenase (short-subunit alcohol dehydrogenase family)